MEHKTISLADQVFEKLENDILSGVYQKGELLTELKLCDELGVSRTPIREALRRLSQEHIIEESGKGSIVLGIDKSDLKDIYAIRTRIEGMAAALAAQNASPSQLEELKEAVELQEFYVAKNDANHIKMFDSRFHEILYNCSASKVLYDTLMPLHKKVLKFRKASVESPDRAESSALEHKAIYEAIVAGDSALADERMTEHIKKAYEHILQGEK